MAEMRLFEAIYSLPQITRYKPDPVPREAIDKMRVSQVLIYYPV
jgi:hypothetical protein